MNPWSSLESQGTCVSAFGSHWNQHAFVVDIEHLLVNIRVPWIQLLLALCRLVKAGFSNLAVLTGASDSARFFFVILVVQNAVFAGFGGSNASASTGSQCVFSRR